MLTLVLVKETFEDAQDDTPRPSSFSVKSSTSANRSSSTARIQTTDATPSDPQLPNGKAEQNSNGQNHAETASPAKSPSFNAQRMASASVDDVSLQEGWSAAAYATGDWRLVARPGQRKPFLVNINDPDKLLSTRMLTPR